MTVVIMTRIILLFSSVFRNAKIKAIIAIKFITEIILLVFLKILIL